MDIHNITSINNLMINRKIVDISIQSEIFLKHNKYDFISESFALN